MQAPRAADLLNEPLVLQALEQAWNDSSSGNPAQRHEEGGWIYMDEAIGNLAVRRAAAGGQASLDLSTPPIVPGAVVVGTFHTRIRTRVRRDGSQARVWPIRLLLALLVYHFLFVPMTAFIPPDPTRGAAGWPEAPVTRPEPLRWRLRSWQTVW